MQAAILDEVDNPLQFLPLKPDAVRLAYINHNAGAAGEILLIHQFAAFRTGNIEFAGANLGLRFCRICRWIIDHDTLLLLSALADLLKRCRIEPDTAACVAFVNSGAADIGRFQEQSTAWAHAFQAACDIMSVDCLAAIRAMLHALEYRAKTERTGRKRQD